MTPLGHAAKHIAHATPHDRTGTPQPYRTHARPRAIPEWLQINLDRFGSAVEVLSPMFERICRNIGGHSSPFEQSNVHPTIKELEEDWATLGELRNAYLKV